MARIELNHWFINNNELSISLIRFYISIKVLKSNQSIYCRLYIKGNDDEDLILDFCTIEDALLFTEKVINKCCDLNEVLEKYNLMFSNEKNDSEPSKDDFQLILKKRGISY